MINISNKFHLVGIGGVGMTPLALYLNESGFSVSGSDINDFRMKDILASKGIKIYFNHNSNNVPLDSTLIYSSAIPDDNIELIFAKKNSIPIFSRIEALKNIIEGKNLVAITGSYGKSTLTTFISYAFNSASYDPSWLIGADLLKFNPAKRGNGKLFILECDESRKEFLDFNPFLTFLTNIGTDHLANYDNSKENLYNALHKFLGRTDKNGIIFSNSDDPSSERIIHDLKDKEIKIVKCGKNNFSDYTYKMKSSFFEGRKIVTNISITDKDGFLVDSQINMPGERNALDACLTYAALSELGFDKSKANNIINSLPIIDRRFEILSINDKSIVIDDEGDSPYVIENVLKDARFYFPSKKIVTVVQPHRYTRLKSLFSEYVRVLSDYSDDLILVPVYEASEKKIIGVDSSSLADAIFERGFKGRIFVASDLLEAVNSCRVYLNKDCVIITLGPGNIWKVAYELSKK